MLINSKQISHALSQKPALLIGWSFIASFGAYFCMYAFRKPFNAGEYEGYEALGMSLKSLLILSQVFGYMLSKFIGIKIISELRANQRVRLIIGLIVFAELALLFFGLVPVGYKSVFLFLNGVPLGMVWGVVFSFLEGRRTTELIATGLSVSAIISSGSLKSIGRLMIDYYQVSEFWLPVLVGCLFLTPFLLFVWMLKQIPPPDAQDIDLKSKRDVMNVSERRLVFRKYAFGLVPLILTYMMFTVFRDFRDNFAVEIWHDMDKTSPSSVFTDSEIPVSIMVVLTTAFLVFFRNNLKGLLFTLAMIFCGLLLIFVSTLLYAQQELSPINWMLCNGFGLYMAYVPFQIVLFERFVALFSIRGNAGYFMYLSDSIGYLGSIAVLLYKEFFTTPTHWLDFFTEMSLIIALTGMVCLLTAVLFILRKHQKQQKWCIVS